MSAERLREAAALMRERAEKATPGPWWSRYGGEPGYVYASSAQSLVATTEQLREPSPDARFIASWDPLVALAVAAWLDKEAELWTALEALEIRVSQTEMTMSIPYSSQAEAVAVADAYLGAAS